MMKRIIIRALIISFLILLISVAGLLFVPRHYSLPPIIARPTTQFVTLTTGSKIGYTLIEAEQPREKSSLIVYLHGGPGGRISNATIETLSELSNDGFDILFYDQIGSGYSDRLKNIRDYTVDRHIRDLEALLKHFGREKVILVGQSWGCILATYFVSQFPEKIDKIVLTNPGPLYPYPKSLENIPAPDSLNLKSPIFTNAQGNNKVKNWRTSTINFFALQMGLKLASDEEADEFSSYANFEINKSCVFDTAKILKLSDVKSIPNFSGYYAGLMTFDNFQELNDPRPILKTLDTPVLVIKSQYDNQKWGFTQEYLTLFKNSQLKVIPKAGHIIELEQANTLGHTIQAFLH